jgi:hypothetical protein
VEFVFGLDRLLNTDNGLKGFYIGKVINDGATDPQGRIKARIESLFGDAKTGIADADLPWIQMMPSCGLYVRPQTGDFVTIVFQGTVYEGFYIGHTVHANSNLCGGKLNEEFVLNLHNSCIKGKYDGSEFEINVGGGKSVIKAENGDITIHAAGNVNVEHGINVTMAGNVAPTGSGPWCALPFCAMTGAPQVGNTVMPAVSA